MAFLSVVGLAGFCVNVGGGGAVVSTVHVRESPSLIALAPCSAFTWNVWVPSASGPGFVFEALVPVPQAANAAPSYEHMNVTELVSV